ncbi:MAG: VOC family protein [Gemmatimonadales bacterium]
MGSSADQNITATRKPKAAIRQAAIAGKRRTAGRKAATTRQRRAPGTKAAAAHSTPSVVPMISYEDGITALEWFRSAFGFRETARFTTPDGRLSHGEMEAGDGLIMLASPTPEYRSPKRHREACEQARKWSAVPWIIDGVLVYVDDLDRHLARAKAADATILSEIEDGPPGRRYRAEDLEGHRWFFFERDEG